MSIDKYAVLVRKNTILSGGLVDNKTLNTDEEVILPFNKMSIETSPNEPDPNNLVLMTREGIIETINELKDTIFDTKYTATLDDGETLLPTATELNSAYDNRGEVLEVKNLQGNTVYLTRVPVNDHTDPDYDENKIPQVAMKEGEGVLVILKSNGIFEEAGFTNDQFVIDQTKNQLPIILDDLDKRILENQNDIDNINDKQVIISDSTLANFKDNSETLLSLNYLDNNYKDKNTQESKDESQDLAILDNGNLISGLTTSKLDKDATDGDTRFSSTDRGIRIVDNRNEIDKLILLSDEVTALEDAATIIVATSDVFDVPNTTTGGTIPYQTVKLIGNERTNPADANDKQNLLSLENTATGSIGDTVVIHNSISWLSNKRFKTQVHGSITKAANQGVSNIIVNLMRQNGTDQAFVEKSDAFTLDDADTFHSYSFSDDTILGDETTGDVRFFVQVIPDGTGISVSVGADMIIEEKDSISSSSFKTDKLIATDPTNEGGATQAAINIENSKAKQISNRISGISTMEGNSLGDIPSGSIDSKEIIVMQNNLINENILSDTEEETSLSALETLVNYGLGATVSVATNTITNPAPPEEDDDFMVNEINRFGGGIDE